MPEYSFTTYLFDLDGTLIDSVELIRRLHHDSLVKSHPGVDDVLRALKGKGMRIGVVTSTLRRGTLRGLSCRGLDGLFDAIVAADDVERHKPDPWPVLVALQQLGSEPASAVFVGDSSHDLVAGHQAGVKTAAALWGPFPREWLEPQAPDYWLDAPRDVMGLAGLA